MSHLVLARKYRPKTFDQVVGQDVIVATLKAAIEKDRVAHAMLFTGGRGIGKTTIARIVAKALVCLSPHKAEPCGTCAQCIAIDNFSSLDVVEIDGASHTGVDDIRDLRDSARYQPTSAKYKIFIIDEVHMLSISAFNALLKILEEPPPHVIFIFATTESHKIPKTILSRCQRYDFKRVSVETIFLTLKNIMKIEGAAIEDDGLRLIASMADGGLRDALSLAEQILSTALEHYSADFIALSLGVVSHRAVKDICQALIDGQVDAALLTIKDVYEKGLDLCQLMDAMAERFRVLSLCAHVEQKKAMVIIPAVDDSDFVVAQNYDKADLKRLFAMAIDGVTQVFSAHKPLFALELFVLRAALRPPISDAVTINYCLQKLDAIMHNRPLPNSPLPEGKVSVRVESVASSPVLPSPLVPLPPVEEGNSAGDVVQLFSRLVSDLSKSAPILAGHLRFARPELDDKQEVLTLHFEQSLHFEQVTSHQGNQSFKNAMVAVFGRILRLSLKLKSSLTESVKTIKTVAEADEERLRTEQNALYDKARSNPLVKKALEIFGGDITEVKKIDTHLN